MDGSGFFSIDPPRCCDSNSDSESGWEGDLETELDEDEPVEFSVSLSTHYECKDVSCCYNRYHHTCINSLIYAVVIGRTKSRSRVMWLVANL